MSNHNIRIIYMGNPGFAVTPLSLLLDNGFDVCAVVTNPDKPAGRGRKLRETPVKEFAQKRGLHIIQPPHLKDQTFIQSLQSFNPDLFIVVAFRILPEQVWTIPSKGTINLHASLLPDYRGAAPINHAIMNGETKTGVTTFFIDKHMDTGNILFKTEVPIGKTENAGQLHDKLMKEGATLVVKTAIAIESGDYEVVKQSELMQEQQQYKTAPKITKDDCRIQWNNPSESIYNFIRGLSPYPGAWSLMHIEGGKTVLIKIYAATYEITDHQHKPGEIIIQNGVLYVATKDGYIIVEKIQSAGKKILPVTEFMKGFRITKGSYID
jgi:methionyl-tRNA formyltransferase